MQTRHMSLALLLMLVVAACRARRAQFAELHSVLCTRAGLRTCRIVRAPACERRTPRRMRQQIAALHPLFAEYHDLDKAIADGYEFVGPCVSDPALGGMGDHYSLNAEIDFGRGDGTYALDRPQYLVYDPRKTAVDGSQRSITPFRMRDGPARNRPHSLVFHSHVMMDSECGCSISGCSNTIRQGCSQISTRRFRSVERRAISHTPNDVRWARFLCTRRSVSTPRPECPDRVASAVRQGPGTRRPSARPHRQRGRQGPSRLDGGEPGIGKTRLAEELAARASRTPRSHGHAASRGCGTAVFGRGLKLSGPCCGRSRWRSSHSRCRALSASARWFRTWCRLQRLQPRPRHSRRHSTAISCSSRSTLLQRASSRAPLVVILDDLHQADAVSLRLLEFVARELPTAGCSSS